MAGEPERQTQNVVAFKKREIAAKPAPAPKFDPDADRQRLRTNLFALLFAALLVAAGWLLVQKLVQSAHIQDCMMSGRSNCAPITVRPRG
jgi:hypothetical protein